MSLWSILPQRSGKLMAARANCSGERLKRWALTNIPATTGIAFGALANSLERMARQADVREFVSDGKLVLLTPYAPTAGFSVGAAMGRNKLIYGLAEFAVVVSSDHQTGGTWAGAVEALKARWCPVLARDGDTVPRGNKELLKLGAMALPSNERPDISNLAERVQQHAPGNAAESELFDFALRDKPR